MFLVGKKKEEECGLIQLYAHFIPTPFLAVLFTLPLLLWVLRSVASLWCWWWVPMLAMNCQHPSPLAEGIWCSCWWFLILHLGSTLDHFYMFINMHLHFSLSSLDCRSTLHPNLLYMVTFTYVRYYFFILFVNPKTSFIKLQVCTSSARNGIGIKKWKKARENLVLCLYRYLTKEK